MIKHLSLTNFVLVEKAEIAFGSHLNIVTGETGAGKTAIIEALGLALGARADTSLIRQNADRALVEAVFDCTSLPRIHTLLDDAGIPADDELIIKREISHEGKNRAYINCQLVPLPFLQKVGHELIDFIGQHANQLLRTSDYQRNLIDIFGNLQNDLSTFQSSLNKEQELKARLEELKSKEVHLEKSEELMRHQLQEIESVNLKEGEEEELFQCYQRLAHSQEIGEKLKEILDTLSEAQPSVISQLNRVRKVAETLVKIDPALQEPSSLIEQALISLQEALMQFDAYQAKLEQDPNAFNLLENRLSIISRFKKKFGSTVPLINAFKHKILNELSELENLSALFQDTEKEWRIAEQETTNLAQKLTANRQASATTLQQLLSAQLQTLNMSKAEVHIELRPQTRSREGDDQVHFWLKANPGEQPALVKEHSSGGELSRLFLALKIALADKNQTPTLIFDEIDANVGGKTATIIGDKLAELGKKRQVICITHFPQVAAKADTHFSVQKEEIDGRTLTHIKVLNNKERDVELLRMLGGEQSLLTSRPKS